MEGKTLESNARRSRRWKSLGRVALVLLSIGLATSATAAAASKPLRHAVQVGSYRVERDVTPGRNKVVGTLTNVSRARIHATRVSFRLFDAKGRAIGRAVDEVHDLEPGQTWKFHARARGNVSRAHLLRVETE
ncbi:FxLYD domain-containing protein [Dyella humicola]|uniref:FxLYD domain-containing protein n=1 Tax=Dyella humicola TaxID=2992126 RepID=UPI0022596E5C